jgi:hypothetical protein
MVVLTLAMLALFASSAPTQDCVTKADLPITLVAQVVDELWLPLPGARVTIRGMARYR